MIVAIAIIATPSKKDSCWSSLLKVMVTFF